MRITDWPKEDRPREKLLSLGEKSLTDAELIAIFIKSGIRGKTALDIAKELLQEFFGIKGLLRASQQELTRKRGLGNAKYALLKAAVELGKRYSEERLPIGTLLNDSRSTQRFLNYRLRELAYEVFACLFMDTHLRLIQYEELFYGTINGAYVYPREIVRRGLRYNAAKIILAHNHPSGRPLPSTADKDLTVFIKEAVGLVDIEVVDHIIIGAETNYSFAEAGLL